MASDFSRTLALLRREKRISQRTAAGDLQVSQALLSHYENGLREPGLAFVVRAADYFGVSCAICSAAVCLATVAGFPLPLSRRRERRIPTRWPRCTKS